MESKRRDNREWRPSAPGQLQRPVGQGQDGRQLSAAHLLDEVSADGSAPADYRCEGCAISFW